MQKRDYQYHFTDEETDTADLSSSLKAKASK